MATGPEAGAAVVGLVGHGQHDGRGFLRLESQHEDGAPGVNLVGRTAPPHSRAALAVVDAAVAHDVLVAVDVGQPLAPSGPARAAHLEHVGEVSIEANREWDLDAVQPEVGDADPLDAARIPEDARAVNVHLAPRQGDVPVTHDVGVGEIRIEDRIVDADRGAEEQRTVAEQQQLEPRQEPRAVVIHALLARVAGHDVAAVIEDAEAVPVLEDTERRDRPLGAGNDRKVFVDHRGCNSVREEGGARRHAPIELNVLLRHACGGKA